MNDSSKLLNDPQSGHCTIAEVCSYFRVGRTTAYKWLSERKIEGVKIGGKRMVTWASVRHLAAASTDITQKI